MLRGAAKVVRRRRAGLGLASWGSYHGLYDEGLMWVIYMMV